MKVVIAIDSFKGSLSSMEAGTAIREGILNIRSDADVVVKPLADGGEGTTDALIEGLGGEKVFLTVTGPLNREVTACYGYIKETKTAIIEMASGAGITLISRDERDPLKTTTKGVGEMICHAMDNGCRNFIIGIGGSATNDGGIGMLKSLGVRFCDEEGNDVGEGAQALSKINKIELSCIHPLIKECKFQVACDVNNPLCGEMGATYIYGPQKGVTEDMKEMIDQAMAFYAEKTAQIVGDDFSKTSGAGAAGGLGFAFLSYLGAELLPGVQLILDAIRLEEEVKDADIVVTGEGRLDYQTAMGKAPIGVARLAKKYGAKVLAFAGAVTEDAVACNKEGIDAFFPIVRGVTTLDEAMNLVNARRNMIATVEQVFRIM